MWALLTDELKMTKIEETKINFKIDYQTIFHLMENKSRTSGK